MKVLKPAQVRALNALADHVYEVAKSKGFHRRKKIPMGDMLANIHGEVSELWEAYRKNILHKKSDKSAKVEEMRLGVLTNLDEELADILIRVLDTAKTFNRDIARAVRLKDAYNQTRSFRHGNKKA